MKRGRYLFTFLSILLLLSFVHADVASEIQKLIHYAEEYETGNIDYARLIVYTGAVREQLNEDLGVIDRREGGIMNEEQVRKALGEPTEKTKWVWSEEENKKLSESIPAWRKLVFDGNKIQIYIEAYPSLYRKGHRNEEGKFIPDENTKEEIVYRIHFNIKYKQDEEDVDLENKIADIKNLAEKYFVDQSSDNAEMLAKEMVFVENAFRSAHENPINCEETINTLIGSENRRSDQGIIVQEISFFEGDDFEVILQSEMCDVCEYHWWNINAHVESRGRFRPEEPSHDRPQEFRGLSNEQYKTEIRGTFEQLKDAYSREDFSTTNSLLMKLQGLQEGWNEKANNIWDEVNKKYESLQKNPQGNDDRYYWIKIEKEKREEIKRLKEANHAERKQFFNEIFLGYEKEETVYTQSQWEKRLFEQFKERGEEICDNNIDDNNNGQVDCDEDQCSGKFAGEETIVEGDGETKIEKKISLFCIAGERKQKEEVVDSLPVCGNHKCDENEYSAEADIPVLADVDLALWKESHVLCTEDCSACPAFEAISCSGTILFKGKDEKGCSLEPFCLEEKSCEQDSDCTFRCGVGVCTEEKTCALQELQECKEAECNDGQETIQNCDDRSQLVVKICTDSLWTETGLKCPIVEGIEKKDSSDDDQSSESSEEQGLPSDNEEVVEEVVEQNVGTACNVKEDCGNVNDVCSNGVCVTLPKIRDDEESLTAEESGETNEESKIVGETGDETTETIDSEIQGAGGKIGNVEAEKGTITGKAIFAFFRGLFSRATITGKATHVEEGEESNEENVNEESNENNNNNQESDEDRRNREEDERRAREQRENEDRANRESGERKRHCDENCARQCSEIVSRCVQKCVFGENGDESNEIEQCESECTTSNQPKITECSDTCVTNCQKGERFEVERNEPEHKEELAVFTISGNCRSSEQKKEAGIHFGGWGEGFQDLHLLKNKYYQDNDVWCKQEIDSLLQQRLEFEKSFNQDFAQWFLDDYLANGADNWMAYSSGIYDLYWSNVDLQRQLAERMQCLDKKDITELYQPQLLSFEYETERGKIKYWEELERVSLHDDGEEVVIITPRMSIWLFPEEKFIKEEMKRAMEAREFPGGNKDNGPSEDEKKMIRQNEKFMTLVREIMDDYKGRIVVQIRDFKTDEVVFNLLMQINERDIMSMQPIPPEENSDIGATILLNSKEVFRLIEKAEKDMQGGRTERPPWDHEKPMKETINEVVNGIDMFLQVNSLFNNAKIIPEDKERNVKKLAKRFLRMAIMQGGEGHREQPEEEKIDEDIFERDSITGEVIKRY